VELDPELSTSRPIAIDQAAAWFARRRSGSWSESLESQFAAWLKADPSHAAAWGSYERLWSRLESVRDDPRILIAREQARNTVFRGRMQRRIWQGAAAVAASVLLAVLLWRNPQAVIHSAPPANGAATGAHGAPAVALVRDAFTEIGERSFLVLPDGSRITLNTASAVHADYTGPERRITLIRGEAFFDVAHDAARPFVVSAGSRQVIAVGTAFDVRLQDRQMKVTLVEGRVRILRANADSQPAAPILLEAGSALVAAEAGADHVEHLDTARVTSWRSGRLVFDGERLADVVAEMNRYSREKLELEDPALEGRKVSGVFESTGGPGFAKALEAYGIARVTQHTATTIMLDTPRKESDR
jgi:transmembrane sensor